LATGTEPLRRSSGACPRAPQSGGFTLLEVLVVVAITGIVIALAVVNFLPGDLEVGRRESGRLALALEHARDAAWFGGRPTALTVDGSRVQEWRLQGPAWKADGSRTEQLDASVRVTDLHVDGEPLKPGSRLVFMPDGLGTPFRVALEVRGLPWAIEGDAAGAVTVSGQ